VLIFIAVDLQLYKIFKITRVSFFGTQCRLSFQQCTVSRRFVVLIGVLHFVKSSADCSSSVLAKLR